MDQSLQWAHMHIFSLHGLFYVRPGFKESNIHGRFLLVLKRKAMLSECKFAIHPFKALFKQNVFYLLI